MDAEKRNRMGAIDAARGLAMLLVYLAHFCDGYCPHLGDAGVALQKRVIILTYAASPTFMMLSGMMLGLLRVSHGPGLGNMRSRLIDRGLFLLVVGHFVILAGVFPWLKPGQATRMFFITDTIGLCVAGGALLSPWLGARARLLAGLPLPGMNLAKRFGSDLILGAINRMISENQIAPIEISLPEQLRVLRAIEVLEYAGTPEAREVLEKLAGGGPQALRTRQSRASLDRLARRSP